MPKKDFRNSLRKPWKKLFGDRDAAASPAPSIAQPAGTLRSRTPKSQAFSKSSQTSAKVQSPERGDVEYGAKTSSSNATEPNAPSTNLSATDAQAAPPSRDAGAKEAKPPTTASTSSVRPTYTTMTLPGTPLDQASGYTRRKHIPPEEQLQGGSWTLDTVTGTYCLGSRLVKDGRMLPSPADPSVYDEMYKLAAAMAKSGDCRLAQHLSVPERYLKPNFIPESFTPGSEFSEKLCLECSAIVERLYIEIFLKQRGETEPLYGPSESQLDVDIKPSIDALSTSAKDGCCMCNFILGALQQLSPYRLERHIRASRSHEFPIQITGDTGEYYRLMVWFRNSRDRDLSKRTKAFEMCATLPRGTRFILH